MWVSPGSASMEMRVPTTVPAGAPGARTEGSGVRSTSLGGSACTVAEERVPIQTMADSQGRVRECLGTVKGIWIFMVRLVMDGVFRCGKSGYRIRDAENKPGVGVLPERRIREPEEFGGKFLARTLSLMDRER